MFGAYGLRAGRDFYRDIPATTRDFGVHGVIIGAALLLQAKSTEDLF